MPVGTGVCLESEPDQFFGGDLHGRVCSGGDRCLHMSREIERGLPVALGWIGITQHHTARLGGGQCQFGAFGNHGALFLRDCRIDMQHERVGVGTEFGDNERNPVIHQARDEVNVPAQANQFCDDDPRGIALALAIAQLAGGIDRGLQLRSPLQRVVALAGLDLDQGLGDQVALGGGEAPDGLALKA
jgi:hypothetical protein